MVARQRGNVARWQGGTAQGGQRVIVHIEQAQVAQEGGKGTWRQHSQF